MDIMEALKNYNSIKKNKIDEIDRIKEELIGINNQRKTLFANHIKEWIVNKSEYLSNNNIVVDYNEYHMKITGLSSTKEDINKFEITIQIENDFICISSFNEDCRYWEQSHLAQRIFSFKQINAVLLYLNKVLRVRVNYRKQRVEHELYKKYRERFMRR